MRQADGAGVTRRGALAGGLAAGSLAMGSLVLAGRRAQAQAAKPAELRIGIATYLSGAASVFGVPARDAADMLIEEINAGGGIGGVKVRPIYVDEGPGVDHVVGEYRRLVQSEDVGLILSGISSADCIACAPLADELRRPTLLWDCGTQRIFEDGRYSYPSRPQGNAISEMLATALYLVKQKPNFRTIAVVNQDYAWGRDSWDVFKSAMSALKPDMKVVAELFPRFGATDYATEITRLLALRPEVVLSTSWGGDLDTFLRQAGDRKLFDRSLFVLPLAESSLERLGKALPPGQIVGARGDHYFLRPDPKDPARLAHFVDAFKARTGHYPIYSCYHMAQALSAAQAAYEKAIKAKGGGWPTDAELAAAFRGLTFASPTSTVTIREDGQGIEDQMLGTTIHVDKYPMAVLTDVVVFPGEAVLNPPGTKGVDWVKTIKPDLAAQMPAPVPYKA